MSCRTSSLALLFFFHRPTLAVTIDTAEAPLGTSSGLQSLLSPLPPIHLPYSAWLPVPVFSLGLRLQPLAPGISWSLHMPRATLSLHCFAPTPTCAITSALTRNSGFQSFCLSGQLWLHLQLRVRCLLWRHFPSPLIMEAPP